MEEAYKGGRGPREGTVGGSFIAFIIAGRDPPPPPPPPPPSGGWRWRREEETCSGV